MNCRVKPCETCPYRKDVPSGVWAESEYRKLPEYDLPTGEQPPGIFYCHSSPDFVCNGWAVAHSANPRGHELLALRFAALRNELLMEIPRSDIPLFASGAEAAAHGMKRIERPTREAVRAIRKLQAARARKLK